MTLSYTPSTVVDQGDLSVAFNMANCLTWDEENLVVVTRDAAGVLGLLVQNNNGTYTPSNVSSQGTLTTGIDGVAWDGHQLVLVNNLSLAYTLARNNDNTYTPGNLSTAVFFPSAVVDGTQGLCWDGTQLVFVNSTNRDLHTVERNADNTYSFGDSSKVTDHGTLPVGISVPSSIVWDDTQLVIIGRGDREVFTLARNLDGTYTPADAASSGTLPAAASTPRGLAWDGTRLVILADS